MMKRNLENLHEANMLQASHLESPQTSTQIPGAERDKENERLFQVEEEAIEKAKEDGNILDTKEQVELLQQYLDSVKAAGNTAEINKCMGQLLNLKKKYAEITGGIEIYRSPNRSLVMGKRRENEEEDDGDIVDATLTGKEGSPRLGEGMRELMGERT